MNRTCYNSRGGWTRVANLDMTDPNQQCPSGLAIVTSPSVLVVDPLLPVLKGVYQLPSLSMVLNIQE